MKRQMYRSSSRLTLAVRVVFVTFTVGIGLRLKTRTGLRRTPYI